MVVHSILPRSVEEARRALAATPPGAGYVEIRADHLDPEACARAVSDSPRPSIVTVRAAGEGGGFTGSTADKRAILTRALAAGASFVDVEAGGPLADLAEGAEAGRTILSHHGARCTDDALRGELSRLRRSRAARLKIVPRAERAREIDAVRRLLAAPGEGAPLAAFASGRAGAPSRVFALFWGSWATYGAAARGCETAPGQLTSDDLLRVYRVGTIDEGTRTFALAGAPVLESPSPAMHAAGYRALGLDAVYVPFECTDLDDLRVLPLDGFAVTTPLKLEAGRRCVRLAPSAASGAVNTVLVRDEGWVGHNTDVEAAQALLPRALPLEGARVAIVGAGGGARSLREMLEGAGASVTQYARRPMPGVVSLDRLAEARWDLLVNATPLGRKGEEILPADGLLGRAVLDLAYGSGATPLVRDARARGLATIDGPSFLLEQAVRQFARLTGRHAPRAILAAALDARQGAA